MILFITIDIVYSFVHYLLFIIKDFQTIKTESITCKVFELTSSKSNPNNDIIVFCPKEITNYQLC